MEKEKIVVGMSGGVDSSVAAYILKKQGYEVIGVTMKLWDDDLPINDAKKVCQELKIQHFVADFGEEFKMRVVEYFAREYQSGRTPNPCIMCNKFLKFDALQRYAKTLGAEKIATGHYAKVIYNESTKRYNLLPASSSEKDQTYVLYSLTQQQLKNTIMPLGEMEDKSQTRRLAEEIGLEVSDKADSMEICFIPDNDYVSFLKNNMGAKPKTGDFVDAKGNVLGRHSGIINYTIGQRKGLGVAFGKPMFVTRIDAEKNQVVLGEKGTEFSKQLLANQLNFISIEKLNQPMEVLAKVRYSAKPAPATVYPVDSDSSKVVFENPQRAITPGQAVVFYDKGDMGVIGGGVIQ